MKDEPKIRPKEEPRHPEKRLTTYHILQKITAQNAREINKELESQYGLQNFVDESLHINPHAFSQKVGGIYTEENIALDVQKVDTLDRTNSAADNPNTQTFYRETYGSQSPEDIVNQYRKNKDMSKSSQAEMAITALMHKVLKERFLVVRTSVFDDYTNGVDNLILDKETGAVICAFDEVLENEGDQERGPSKKIAKVLKSAKRGGTQAKYGVSLVDKRITRAAIKNVPVFYLPLKSDDLATLTKDLHYSQSKETTDTEKRLFAHLVTSIEEQKTMLEKEQLPSTIRQKLRDFDESLAALKKFAEKK